ncbi:hypothetical protein SNOG_11370 [Parastagonospora nodorum SN15]|uniref:Uncharacterized protein n=1 Tax=Phaeosphaeria nodorum (strain SN15 / ATCC MYA-4574 / FGSC 10173) TaxID=321614 RepID=Q0UA44_PHANO|nr:hypothetical protein SNOG_11370 [Parastagonospora nodorum SN15]EAT81078.1 hypothetical protein SNOG_11370 [Parastagonospora nodorum SN15]
MAGHTRRPNYNMHFLNGINSVSPDRVETLNNDYRKGDKYHCWELADFEVDESNLLCLQDI